MLKIDFNHTNYEELLKFLAAELKVKVKDNCLQLPSHLGEGFMKLIQLPNGLQGIISDYIVYEDFLLNRTKINLDYFTLRFDEVAIPENISTDTTAALPIGVSPVRSAVFLGSSKYDWMFFCTKGTRVKGVNILFSKEWLEQFLKVESVGDIIRKYLSLRMSAFNYEPMDMEYKRLLGEIVQTDVNLPYETLIIQ
ncbi:MAG TPA: hypothetical protein VGB63_13880, partial [Pedobacter sp.]